METLGIIERYRDFLPITEKTPLITLKEGNTPLILATNLSKKLGADSYEIYLKFEGLNPTGSFKDRGMTLAVSKALENGSKAIMCASTGNTSASAAAYAAKAGMRCIVLIPSGQIALGKLSQALMHGAKVIAIEGNFDDALNLVKEATKQYPITLVNSINPFRIEGQKTAAFEIVDELGEAPDYQFMPVGNAGNITAYWKGYKEYCDKGKCVNLPKMMGFQAEGASPLVKGTPIKNPETLATAIRIGNPASWDGAIRARDESAGAIDSVTDDEIIEAYKMLAELEGIFCEPASAASVAGLKKFLFQKKLEKRIVKLRIVCILTGHGLKDPERAILTIEKPETIQPTLESLNKIL
ncbi:MAG: threonine synthase [Elusimicrobia bacterium RIFCSPLOWO2_02_FULL_39_32]|nr:MAG: threonine synthase [Elusimicrobia bacterium RIFCSPHIGHO2_02_FULL_39_36]OGR91249.1 MAG: threonine synthase [Elusimicrobia bacterium RIFCSPLOWO2_02_FULL_39_32]OGS00623.1 MAG: threonine synthase [Elusimicrobia bacterium RIFCSPLOWO2_12_FULL_39_28]